MKYKAIFLDVDGTTVVHGLESLPSPRVKLAVKNAKRHVAVCLATSRPLRSIHGVIDALKLNGLCVVASGTQIYDPKQNKIINELLFPKRAMKTILDIAVSYKKRLVVFDGDKEVAYDGIHVPKKVVGMWFPELESDVLTDIHRELSTIEGISSHRMSSWKPGLECLDITQKNASKLHGIVEVARMMGIETKEIIGVGDGYNDFPLLMACGLKIAMGNAVPELKAIADFVAPTVEEDGLVVVIEKYILS